MTGQHNHLLASLLAIDPSSEFRAHFRTVELRSGEVLAEPFEKLTRVYFPYSGIISFLVPLSDGHIVQTGMIGNDGAVGGLQALDGHISPNRIVVLVPGNAAVLDAQQVSEMAQASPRLRQLFLSNEQFVFAEVQQSVACNAVHTVRQRVCRWLLRMNDLIGVNLTVTQELFSEMIGVRRTSISAAAASLQDAGIIRYSRGHIRINDIEGLKQSSCECYAAVKDQYERLVNGGNPP